ncbi:S-adenosyl-L-methionine-dependent methyltransferase [Ceratobasidium theobromae]|uniref:S-adenosyl-L-methionine-dependent methyltransferase n=1 Tax=Ceratobasidium theobromae TaxID=1582974 RepID=A0A5N5QP14_9AGAM|nr:S-adenosyl-L-methionine-dependent methyltransferase [Ceratobasidium theobromae]
MFDIRWSTQAPSSLQAILPITTMNSTPAALLFIPGLRQASVQRASIFRPFASLSVTSPTGTAYLPQDSVLATRPDKPQLIPHATRYHQSAPRAEYLLPSDRIEADRLQLQHDMFKALYDNKILLSKARLNKKSQVLDSGVGSGSWLMALTKEIPGISIQGIDIEGNLFPRPLPNNVNLARMSVLDLPLKWTNRFDLVHQRGFVLGLRREEWPVALAQLYRVTKPGGYIQLLDGNLSRARNVGPANKVQNAMLAELCRRRGLMLNVTDHLADMVRAAGFKDVKEDGRNIVMSSRNGKMGRDAWMNQYLAFKGLKTPMLKAGGLNLVQTEGEFDQMIEDMGREWEEKGGECGYVVICARKPLKSHHRYPTTSADCDLHVERKNLA